MKKIKKELTAEWFGNLMGTVARWMISAAFIWWGWSVLAPHLNAPLFSYWEVFAIRMGLTYLMAILWQRPHD